MSANKIEGAAVGTAASTANPANKGPVVVGIRDRADARTTAPIAARIAQRIGRPIVVVSAVEPMPLYGLPQEVQVNSAEIDMQALQSREAEIGGPVAELFPAGTELSLEVMASRPTEAVPDRARALNASIAVVGASPHRTLRRVVAGKRATQILQRSTVPVLSVVPWLKDLPASALVAVDFGAPSIRAAEGALMLLREGGTMVLGYVMPPNYFFPMPSSPGSDVRKGAIAQLREVREYLRTLGRADVKITCEVLEGDPAAELLNYADSHAIELVAAGTQGRGRLGKMLLGSVASELFHGALCTVLVAPPPSVADELRLNLVLRGTAVASDPSTFAALLDGFTQRNRGRSATLEEDDPAIGAQVQAAGYRLSGVTYDHRDGRVEVMLAVDPAAQSHLTRNIAGVNSISITTDAHGRDVALQVRHGDSQTLLLLQ